MFSLSFLELIVSATLLVGGAIVSWRQIAAGRWLIPLAGCFTLAALLTPADLATTLVVTLAMTGCFFWGTRQRIVRSSPDS